MKITVNPPTEINEVTGEEVQVSDSSRIIKTGKEVNNTYTHGEADNLAVKPMDRKPVLRDPAFQPDATQQDILNYWTNGRQPTDDEMLHIQEEYTRTNDEQLARFLTYKMTGNTDQLLPADIEALGIEEQVEQPSNYLTTEEIDHDILATDDSNDYNPEYAQSIATADLGQSPEMITVKHLAAQVYEGQLTRQEAYIKAANSGISQAKLYAAYNRLKAYFGG